MRDKKGRFIKGHKVPKKWSESVAKRNMGKKFHLGFRHSYKARPKAKGRMVWNKNKPVLQIRGDRHWNWQGGKTEISHKIKSSLEYRLWRKAVFERDNYTCVWCGYKSHTTIKGRSDIHADHIKPFALFPELRLAIDNGRTLCIPCHRTTNTFGMHGTI